jgi:hypothetical protein
MLTVRRLLVAFQTTKLNLTRKIMFTQTTWDFWDIDGDLRVCGCILGGCDGGFDREDQSAGGSRDGGKVEYSTSPFPATYIILAVSHYY